MSANRVYVEDSIYDDFAQIVAEKIAALKVGDGFEEGITQGPLINQAAIEKPSATSRWRWRRERKPSSAGDDTRAAAIFSSRLC